jgi:6-pyruvoyltetrahydropterin/6-carboxytetrahydropterin synthase
MLRLTRTVRLSINPPATPPHASPNGYAAAPSMHGLGRHYELSVACRGSADPITGYLIDIKAVDKAVHAILLPLIQNACANNALADPAAVLASGVNDLGRALDGRVESVRWNLSPYYSVEVSPEAHDLPAHARRAAPHFALLRQRFDFAAAHRLNVPTLSPEQNRALFGKCNNPGGHGHNYQLEPVVEVPLHDQPAFSLQDLERAVQRAIIDRFDHKHLNQDTPEFCVEQGGVNPSVENIARVFFDLLSAALASAPVRLRAITVWETDRTCATYPA